MGIPKIMLFDLDGTLIDTKDVVARIYAEGLQRMGLDVPGHEYIKSLSGLSTHETGRRLGVPEQRLEEIDRHFWQGFSEFSRSRVGGDVFGTTPAVIRQLRAFGIALGVVTSNERKNAISLLEQVGLDSEFAEVVGFREVSQPKPSGEGIVLAISRICKKLDIEISDRSREVWMVGDTESDFMAAVDAGVRGIILGRDIMGLEDLIEWVSRENA